MERRKPVIEFIGPLSLHDVGCWLCDEDRPAVYDMHPHWVFRPCWQCQREIALANPPAKPWWKFWGS